VASAIAKEISISVVERGDVSALFLRPRGARCLYLLAHGAGAGMNHVFMEAIAARLAHYKIATLRFQFPFTEAGRRRPDHAKTLIATVRAAAARAARIARGLPIIAGGKSMGGRMTSQAQASEPLPGVQALAFLGFPLHPAKKPGTDRADHLRNVQVPMLFLQGTRDALADLELLRPVVRALAARPSSRDTLHIVDGADHGFGVLKRSGRTNDEVLDELAAGVANFAAGVTR